MKLDPQLVLWASIVLSIGPIIYVACQAFSPFGFNSRCRHVRTLRFKDGSVTELFIADGNMAQAMIKDFLRQHHLEILNLRDLRRIVTNKDNRDRLPRASRIVGGQDGLVWAIDTADWFSHRKCRVVRLAGIETPTSFEHCYIAAKPCT